MKITSIKFLILSLATALACLVSCSKDEVKEDPVTDVAISIGDKQVSFRGQTVTVSFDAPAAWTASLKLLGGEGEWAAISSRNSGEGKTGCTVRVAFEENKTPEERVAELWVTVDGYPAQCICTLVQALSGASAEAKLNTALNTYMHEILKEDYLFKDAYNAQEIDLGVNYSDFLSRHLLSLGDENVADGGYYRASHANAGERYIYTNLVEIQAASKAAETYGFGFGPFISTALEAGSQFMAIAPAYVRRGSPAEAAGLRRGDLVYEVNGTVLTTSNYYSYMVNLYQGQTGSYSFKFLRYEPNDVGGYSLNPYESAVVTASSHVYDPVLHASVLSDPEDDSKKIGYLVYESFDLNSQDILAETVNDFKSKGITDLILDLRFNAGGAVAQSRWLSGCIAGDANGDKTFTKVIYNNGAEENWKFNYGYNNDTDPLGKPVDLGLSRLWVICSYNTASAAELVISSLKGIDFDLKMIGCRTEGKNVGMVVTEYTAYNGRRFQFSPVTFWVQNAKGWGDYPDGMEPHEYVNNDNGLSTDDVDNAFPYSFSDWGNMDFNIALQWAYCDITGKERWNSGTKTRASSFEIPLPTECIPYEPLHGHTGNLVYGNDNK